MNHLFSKVKDHYKKITIFLACILVIITFAAMHLVSVAETKATSLEFWSFSSVDTMKFSRDLSREKLSDPVFDQIIDEQVGNIARTGASHVAIATPYDDEFLPILKRWVIAARRYNLQVWFRGNFSGWEQWFDYKEISREEHMALTKRFIENNPDLFRDGDVFSACPECENGGPGDPRSTGDVKGHRAFLIEEYNVTKNAFKKIGKNVTSNYNSMNGDVARLVMDKPTTQALDGIVVIDHYVSSIEKMRKDLESISEQSGGKIVLGEFGAPIPDINGEMNEEEQAKWLEETLKMFTETNSVVGVNYWVNKGGSTQLWNDDESARKSVGVLTSYYLPSKKMITIQNPLGQKVTNAHLHIGSRVYISNNEGVISVPTVLLPYAEAEITAKGYTTKSGLLASDATLIILEKSHEDIAYKLMKLLNFTLNIPRKN